MVVTWGNVGLKTSIPELLYFPGYTVYMCWCILGEPATLNTILSYVCQWPKIPNEPQYELEAIEINFAGNCDLLMCMPVGSFKPQTKNAKYQNRDG